MTNSSLKYDENPIILMQKPLSAYAIPKSLNMPLKIPHKLVEYLLANPKCKKESSSYHSIYTLQEWFPFIVNQ
jgi:hypothetical protein